MFDVLIAGGGIAGSALAIQLGRQGLRVALFERGGFPREKPCGEGLMPAGVVALRRLGVADRLRHAAFSGIRYHFGSRVVEGAFPQVAGSRMEGWGLRRRDFDQALFEAAAAAPGVIAQTGARVEAPLRERGRVRGAVVGGKAFRARLVVAADGARSPLRRMLGLERPVRRKRFGVRAHFRLAGEMPQPAWVDVYVARGHEMYVTALPEGELLVAALAETQPLGESLNRVFARWCASEAHLAARLKDAEQITPLAGTAPLAARARSAAIPGIVLLGDAAGFLDPITGGGMTHALTTAELLASFMRTRDLAHADDWLPQFEREREILLRDQRVLTRMILSLTRHPWLAERVMAGLGAIPPLFRHLIGVSGGLHRLISLPAWSARY